MIIMKKLYESTMIIMKKLYESLNNIIKYIVKNKRRLGNMSQ